MNQNNNPQILWDHYAKKSIITWLSVSEESGITFSNNPIPCRNGKQALINFSIPDSNKSEPLREYINYTVDDRVQTGEYLILAEVSAELITDSGKKIHDVGTIHIPVEVDSHLYTKLLMLAVIAVVVLLFIMEWFRIDIVVIIVMIALPELGLLNAGEAFQGLSSNAVIAIIGVMIISFMD